jgi:hypothetical protein
MFSGKEERRRKRKREREMRLCVTFYLQVDHPLWPVSSRVTSSAGKAIERGTLVKHKSHRIYTRMKV